MKHAITLLIATIGCSQPAQQSAFDPEPVVERSEVPPPFPGSALGEPEDNPATVEIAEVAEVPFDKASHPTPSESPPATEATMELSAVTVRAGESLDRLSRWSDTSVEEIAALNAIEITQPLLPGQVLAMPISDREAFEASRNGALEARLERYLSANGGLAGIEGYTVRTGDTAWAIAKEIAGVPSWVLAAFNSDTSLDRLSVGATLYLPIMTHVADAEQPMDELSFEAVDVILDADIMD